MASHRDTKQKSAELAPHPIRIIEEVKKRPGLYQGQTDKKVRLKLWTQVGEALYPDWNTYSKATVYDLVIQLQAKWRSLRDGYCRELRCRNTGVRKYHKTYVYFKKMLFLGGYDGEVSTDDEQEEIIVKKKTTSKRKRKAEAESETRDMQQEYLDLTFLEEEEEILSATSSTSRNKKIKLEANDPDSSSPEPRKVYQVNIPTLQSDQESDRLYLLSFLPELSQLPRNINMWAKRRIAQVMEEAVNCHLNGTSPENITSDPISLYTKND